MLPSFLQSVVLTIYGVDWIRGSEAVACSNNTKVRRWDIDMVRGEDHDSFSLLDASSVQTKTETLNPLKTRRLGKVVIWVLCCYPERLIAWSFINWEGKVEQVSLLDLEILI